MIRICLILKLLWYLDPPFSSTKRHEILKKTLSESKLSVSASAEREREREREREKERELFHLILTSMLYKQLSA